MTTVRKLKKSSTAVAKANSPTLREVQSRLVAEFVRVETRDISNVLEFIKSDRFDRNFRFHIYKTGAMEKHRETLLSYFSLTFGYLSKKATNDICVNYLTRYPSAHVMALDSFATFPAFIKDRTDFPFLHDVAELEWQMACLEYREAEAGIQLDRATWVPPMKVFRLDWNIFAPDGRLISKRKKAVREPLTVAITNNGGDVQIGFIDQAESLYLASLVPNEFEPTLLKALRSRKTQSPTQRLELRRSLFEKRVFEKRGPTKVVV